MGQHGKFYEGDGAPFPSVSPDWVVRAWWGDAAEEWSTEVGMDVTETVKNLLMRKATVAPDWNLFGPDPAEGKQKVLIVEIQQGGQQDDDDKRDEKDDESEDNEFSEDDEDGK